MQNADHARLLGPVCPHENKDYTVLRLLADAVRSISFCCYSAGASWLWIKIRGRHTPAPQTKRRSRMKIRDNAVRFGLFLACGLPIMQMTGALNAWWIKRCLRAGSKHTLRRRAISTQERPYWTIHPKLPQIPAADFTIRNLFRRYLKRVVVFFL